MMETVRVFRNDVANELMKRGYKLLNILPNGTRYGRTVFEFEGGDELYELVTLLKKTMKQVKVNNK